MSLRRVLISAFALAALTGAAPDEERGGRFVMTPVEGGFLRMDSHTGAVSMCQRMSGKWACEAVADDRRALESEIERLGAENRQLGDAIRRLEEQLGSGAPGDRDRRADRSGQRLQLPSEEDVDRAMSYIQRMMRKFKDKLRELESDKDRRSL